MSLLPTPLPWLKVFDVVPGWVYAAAIAALVLGGGGLLGYQYVEIAGLNAKVSAKDTEIAKLKLDAEKDRTDRLQLVAAHNLEIARLQQQHATHQQEIVNAYQDRILKLASERNLALARAERVQRDAEERAARDRQASCNDPASVERVKDHNAVLYGLVSEGYQLVEEGRLLLGERNAQVDALKRITENDRAVICGGN